MTSVRFSLARDTTPLQVTKVEALSGSATTDDLFIVTFNKPVYGFPKAAISSNTTSASSFRYVLGRVSDRRDRERFEEADPSVSGNGFRSVELDENDPYILILHAGPGSFNEEHRFKLFVEPAVEDIFGVPLGGAGFQTEGQL